MRYQIKSRMTDSVLYECDVPADETNKVRVALLAAVSLGVDLSGADLSGADLSEADLRTTNLTDATMTPS